MPPDYSLHGHTDTLLEIARLGGESFLPELVAMLGDDARGNLGIRPCRNGCYPEHTAVVERHGQPKIVILVVGEMLLVGAELPVPPMHTVN